MLLVVGRHTFHRLELQVAVVVVRVVVKCLHKDCRRLAVVLVVKGVVDKQQVVQAVFVVEVVGKVLVLEQQEVLLELVLYSLRELYLLQLEA